MTQDPRRFYVYLFLRSTGSVHDKKYSPYYVGKGSGNRCYGKSGRPANRPKDISYIVTVQEGLTEEEAFSLERYALPCTGGLILKQEFSIIAPMEGKVVLGMLLRKR